MSVPKLLLQVLAHPLNYSECIKNDALELRKKMDIPVKDVHFFSFENYTVFSSIILR